MNPVFSILPKEVNEVILSFCNTRSLTQLSGVNHTAYKLLSNQSFFNNRFYEQHPDLRLYDKILIVFRESHSSNCWKVLCQVLDPSYSKGQFPERLSISFVDKVASQKIAAANLQKEILQNQMQAICGNYYADPNSPIDIAWKESIKMDQECESIYLEEEQLFKQMGEKYRELETVHSDDGASQTLQNFYINAEKFVDISEEGFINTPNEEKEGMLQEHLALYREYARLRLKNEEIIPKINLIKIKLYNSRFVYKQLEFQRVNTQSEIEFCDETINCYKNDPCSAYKNELTFHFHEVQVQELTIKTKLLLEKSKLLITRLSNSSAENKS